MNFAETDLGTFFDFALILIIIDIKDGEFWRISGFWHCAVTHKLKIDSRVTARLKALGKSFPMI